MPDLQKRISTFDTIIKKNKWESFLTFYPTHLTYFSGLHNIEGALFFLAKNKKPFFICDKRYYKRILDLKEFFPQKMEKSFIKTTVSLAKKNKISQISIEKEHLSLSYYQKIAHKCAKENLKIDQTEKVIEKLRLFKDDYEIACIKKASDIASKALKDCLQNFKFGISEKELSWQIEKSIREKGAEDISFPIIVASESNSAIPHHCPSNRKINPGDILLIDMGAKYQGYCSDMTRIFFTSSPSKEIKEKYIFILKLIESLFIKINKNNNYPIHKLVQNMHSSYKDKNLSKALRHSLGHGVGLEVHELPPLQLKTRNSLSEGMVFTIEPGIYFENFGIRVEDTVVIKDNKIVTLTDFTKEITIISG